MPLALFLIKPIYLGPYRRSLRQLRDILDQIYIRPRNRRGTVLVASTTQGNDARDALKHFPVYNHIE